MHGVARLIAHLFRAWGTLGRWFPQSVLDDITAAIAAGEERHLGEICFAVESRLAPLDALLGPGTRQRAEHLFGQLRVWDTENNSGVLVYVLLCEHRIEIVADRALARCLEPAAWQDLVTELARPCREARFEDALCGGVDRLDQLLRAHFPRSEGADRASEGGLPDRPVLR